REAGVVFIDSCPDTPSTVLIAPDGSIRATGPIRSANVKESTMQAELARMRSTYDSLVEIKRSDSVRVKTEYRTITREVRRKAYPLWPWAIAFALGMMAEYKFKFIRFIKQKLIP